MLELYADAYSRLQLYASQRRVKVVERLGMGKDGVVYSTIKAFRMEQMYQSEKVAYLRLKERDIGKIETFNVRRLESFEDLLWVIEIEIVLPPFIIDFVGAGIDRQPLSLSEYSQDDWEEWHETHAETFGEDWPRVSSALSCLRGKAGIYLYDLHADNIRLR